MRKTLAAVAVAGVLATGALAATTAYAVGAGAGGARDMHQQMTSTSMPTHDQSMDAMHAQMREAMPAGVRQACDDAHAAMTAAGVTNPGGTGASSMFGHAAHHAGS